MNKLLIIFFLIALINIKSFGAVYGVDDRELITDSSPYAHYARAVLSQLREGALNKQGKRFFLKTKSLNEHVGNLCEDTPFRETPTFSYCSAFMVSPELMVTAGHCIEDQQECEETTWAFADQMTSSKEIPSQDIVRCEKLVNRLKNSISKNDYALIKISRPISHRPHLNFRTSGVITEDAPLVVIGHPTGLPLISTDQGQIRENDSPFLFKLTSDTFGGNSGSPIINIDTGLVEGILTDGDLDYILDRERGCRTTFKCQEGSCRGENGVRITNIPELVPGMTPEEPIFDPRFPRL